MIKNILRYSIAFVVTTIVFLLMLIIFSAIPKEYIKSNLEKSANILMNQTESIFIDSNGRNIFNHNSTDAIMLNIIYSIDRDNLFESALRARRNYIPEVSKNIFEDIVGNLKFATKKQLLTEEFYDLVNGKTQKVFDYARYWHGYIVILIPLLLFCDIIGIRIILQVILLIFLVLLMYYISKKRSWKYSFIYLFVFIAFDLLAWITTIQGILVMIIAVAFSTFIAKGKINNKNLNICLFISGAITAYLDFFTTPLMAFLLPVITYKLVNLEETTFVKEMISIIKNGFVWLFGYFGLWLMKWVIIDLTLNTNITKLSFEQIILRIGLDSGPKANKNLNLFALFKNCFQAANIVNVTGFIITFVASIIIILKGKIKNFFKSAKVCYYICTIIPLAWFFIVASHSEQHYFFTYRTLLITLLGYMLIVFDDRKNKKDKDIKENA